LAGKTKEKQSPVAQCVKKTGDFVKKNKALVIGVAVVLVLCIAGAVIASVVANGVRPIKQTDLEKTVVGKVGEFDVQYEELRYLACNMAVSMYMNNEDLNWSDEKAQQELQDYVHAAITYNYAILSLCREVGLELGEKAITDAVQDEIEAMVDDECNGKMSEYRTMMEKNYLTDHYVRFCYEVDLLTNELFNVYAKDLELFDYDTAADFMAHAIEDGKLYRTIHVVISGDDAEAKANECYAELENGADFDAMVGKYSQDYEMGVDGYYFTHGEMLESYENAAAALAIGEYSAVTQCGDDYYIIKRLAPQEEFVLNNLDEMFKYYQYSEMNAVIADRQAELTFEPSEFGAGLKYWTLY